MNKKTTKLMATALTATMGAGMATQLVQAAEVTPYEAALEAVITMEKDPSGANIDKAYNAVKALKAGAQKDALNKRVEKVAAPHHKAVYDIMVTARTNKDLKTIGDARKAVAGMAKIFIKDAYTWSSELDNFTIEYQKTVVDTLNAIANGKKEVKQATINELREIIVGLELQRSNEGLLKLVLDYSATLDKVQMDYVNAVLAEVKAATTGDELAVAKAKYNDLLTMKDEALKAAVQSNIGSVITVKEADFATPKVESVSAINGKQVEVKFNKAVDYVSAEYVSNYSVLRNGDSNAVKLTTTEVDSIILSEDEKSVIITFKNDILTDLSVKKDTLFKFIVKDVKDTSGQKVADFTTTLSVNDEKGPSLVTAKANAKTTTNKVTLTFDEPVDATGVLVTVDGKSATVQPGSDYNELIVTTSATLEAGKTYNVTVLNVKDAVGNFMITNPTNTTVKVSTDVVAPVVTEVKTVRDNLIAVTFDKAVTATTLDGQVKLVDASGVAKGGAITVSGQSTDLRTVYLSVGTENFFGNGTTFTGTLYLSNKIKDTAGNTLVATNRSVTFTKDTTKPVAQSVKHLEADTLYTNGVSYNKGALVVTFDESVTVDAGNMKILNASGEDVTAKYFNTIVSNTHNSKEVIVTLKDVLPTGQYRIVLAGGEVKDKSFQTNTNNAQTLTVNATLNSKDTTKPVLGGDVTAVGATSLISGSTLTLNVTDNAGLDLASVQNINNYLVNGAALPTGSYVTLQHQNGSNNDVATDVIVKINMPAGSIATEGAHVVNVVNVKDKAGNLIAPATNTVTLVDDIAPVFASATVASNGSLVLGFSENVVLGTAAKEEFSFKINGTDVAGGNSVITASNGVGNDAGKLVVSFAALVDGGADGDAKTTADNKVFIDIDGDSIYSNGDILVKTGTTTAVGATTVTVSELTSLEVSVVDSPSSANIKDSSSLSNALTKNTKIIVK